MTRGLKELFEEYMFKGLIWISKGKYDAIESPFEIEVFDYLGCEKSFVGYGRDNRGFSAIIGTIEQQKTDLALVKFNQVFYSKRPFNFECELTRAKEDIFLRGKDKNNDHISLALALRGDKLTYMGWMDHALEAELY